MKRSHWDSSELYYWKPRNRYKRLLPNSPAVWCGCDQDLVGNGRKCRRCGAKITQEMKKE